MPSSTGATSKTINIRSNINSTSNNITYYSKFNVIGNDCKYPLISIYFQDTDFDGGLEEVEHLNVFYNDQLIASCGSNNEVCNDYKYCLRNSSLGDQVIPDGNQIVIRIEKGKDSGIASECDYSLWADVTLICSNKSTNGSHSVWTGLFLSN